MQIQIEGLHYHYAAQAGGAADVQALRGVDLTVNSGERVAIIGANGSGKTTLVKQLNGLLRPARGSVLVGDWDTGARTVAQLARRVAYLFQNPDEQLCQRTVWAEVAFGPRHLSFTRNDVQRLVREALVTVGLEPEAQVNPYDLNLSERRRVALAAVMAMDTPVIVLDEPTLGQDGFFVSRLAALLDTWQRAGKTVLAISHDMEFVADHFPRTIVMHEGKVAADGETLRVLTSAGGSGQPALQAPQLLRLARHLGLRPDGPTPADFLAAYRNSAYTTNNL